MSLAQLLIKLMGNPAKPLLNSLCTGGGRMIPSCVEKLLKKGHIAEGALLNQDPRYWPERRAAAVMGFGGLLAPDVFPCSSTVMSNNSLRFV